MKDREQDAQKLARLVADSRTSSFAPFFAARVMARIDQAEEDAVVTALTRLFRPLLGLTLAAAFFLTLFNWQNGSLMGADANALELAFSMPTVSVETAQYLSP
ncbi:MAG: hypothetical protein O2782_07475 [bacterium]|nr:hypothetical protein [bacterium]